MTAFLIWEQYSSLHNIVKEADFEAAEAKAEQAIRKVIGPIKYETITPETPYFNVLQDAIAEVMDYQANLEQSMAGKGVSSVSNDGYSESYTMTEQTALGDEITRFIKQLLSGTGLVGAY